MEKCPSTCHHFMSDQSGTFFQTGRQRPVHASLVVFLWLEANRVNSPINSSVITQFENMRVLSEGKAEGSGRKAEKGWDMSVSRSMVSISRAGKDDGWNAIDGSLCTRRCSSTSVRESTGSSVKGHSVVQSPTWHGKTPV